MALFSFQQINLFFYCKIFYKYYCITFNYVVLLKSIRTKLFKGVVLYMQKDHYFFCYNINVSKFLAGKGVNYITVAIDPKTKKMYSLYKQTEELNQLLTEYKLSK